MKRGGWFPGGTKDFGHIGGMKWEDGAETPIVRLEESQSSSILLKRAAADLR
jgi:hypothetical protein